MIQPMRPEREEGAAGHGGMLNMRKSNHKDVRGFSLIEMMVALVGARNASSLGLRMARRLAEALTEAGFVVTSGLARGIDAEAHRAAMATGTVAVQAGGVDVPYPEENAELARQIRHARVQPVAAGGGNPLRDRAYQSRFILTDHGQDDGALFARVLQAPHDQGAADQKGGYPHATHVVECHGRGQWQMGDGIKPG